MNWRGSLRTTRSLRQEFHRGPRVQQTQTSQSKGEDLPAFGAASNTTAFRDDCFIRQIFNVITKEIKLFQTKKKSK